MKLTGNTSVTAREFCRCRGRSSGEILTKKATNTAHWIIHLWYSYSILTNINHIRKKNYRVRLFALLNIKHIYAMNAIVLQYIR